jgi:hypothetical protein
LLSNHIFLENADGEDCLASSEDLLTEHCNLDDYKRCKVVVPPQAVARNAMVLLLLMALCLQDNLSLSARAAQDAFENATKHTVSKPTLMPVL